MSQFDGYHLNTNRGLDLFGRAGPIILVHGERAGEKLYLGCLQVMSRHASSWCMLNDREGVLVLLLVLILTRV